MIEQYISPLAVGFVFTLLAFGRALPLLLIVLVVTLLFRRRIAARYQFLLWMVVCVRMLMPFSVPSPVSIHGPLEQLAERVFSWTTEPKSSEPYYLAVDAQGDPVPAREAISKVADAPSTPSPVADVSPSETIDWELVLGISIFSVWFLGALLLLTRGVIAHVRFALQVRRCPQLSDRYVRSLLLEECDSIGLRRPNVVEALFLHSPAVFGFAKPTICLPVNLATQLSEQELRWVLRHELAHIKRRDSLWLSIAFFMRALHWYNPLAWLVAARLQTLAEESADEVAVRNSRHDSWTDYARMLLHFAEADGKQAYPAAVGLLCMAAGTSLPKRIDVLLQRRPCRRRIVIVAMWLIIVGLAVVGLTDRTNAKPPRIDAADLHSDDFPPTSLTISTQFAGEGSTFEFRRDVKGLLAKLQSDYPWFEMEPFLTGTLETQSNQTPTLTDGILTASLTPAGIVEMDNLLEALKQSGPRQITVDCRVWRGEFPKEDSRGWFDQRVKTIGDGEQPRPVFAAKLTDVRATQLLQAVPRNVLATPKVQLYNGTTGTILSGQQAPYVTDVAAVSPDAHQAVISVIEEGWKLQFQTFVAEKDVCQLKCVLSNTGVDNVRYAHIPFAGAEPLPSSDMVQVPIVNRSSVRTEASLAPGEDLLIAIPMLHDDRLEDGRRTATFYLLSPRVIPLEETIRQLSQ